MLLSQQKFITFVYFSLTYKTLIVCMFCFFLFSLYSWPASITSSKGNYELIVVLLERYFKNLYKLSCPCGFTFFCLLNAIMFSYRIKTYWFNNQTFPPLYFPIHIFLKEYESLLFQKIKIQGNIKCLKRDTPTWTFLLSTIHNIFVSKQKRSCKWILFRYWK